MNPSINLYTVLQALPVILGGLWKGILKACSTTCETNDITTNNGCIRGGMAICYYCKYDEVDWTATKSSYVAATNILSAFTMVGAAVFKKLKFQKKSGTYNFEYTSDTDTYDLLISMVFEGKTAATGKAFCSLIACCQLVIVIIDNNCEGRVTGVEWNGTDFVEPIVDMKVTRHLDTSGEFGTDKPRDEVDFGGESLCPPIFHDIDQSTFESTYL